MQARWRRSAVQYIDHVTLTFGPQTWNHLPEEITSATSLSDFQRHLKSFLFSHELSYRQQIARKLRTQYAEGIYMRKYYTVTLKSRLSVTQGHWQQNHWIDYTRLSSSRVI